jgi:hypothetical protein
MLRPTLSRVIYLIVWRAKREHGFSPDGMYDWLYHRRVDGERGGGKAQRSPKLQIVSQVRVAVRTGTNLY